MKGAIRSAPVDKRRRPTGKRGHIVAGKLMGPAAGLAICRYEDEDACYLFGRDETRQAEFEDEGIARLRTELAR